MLLPHPPPLVLDGGIAGTKESLWVPTGLRPPCPWLSSSWPQLCSYRLQLRPQLGHPRGLPCGLGILSPTYPKIHSVGCCFSGQIGQGPRLGATYSSLPHCESLEASTIARQGLWLQGQVCPFPIVCSSWLWALLMPPFRICVFQGSAVRLGGASL